MPNRRQTRRPTMATLPDTRVVTVFRHHAQAQRAVDALLDAGFESGQITLSEPDPDVLRHLEPEERDDAAPMASAPTFAAVGAGFGVLLGALVGWATRPLG